jgi:hypothetical protein
VLSLAGFSTRGGVKPRAGATYGRLDFRYLGVLLGWEAEGLALFQSYGHVLVGAGQGKAKERTGPLLVLEPELGFTWKMTQHLRGLVGVSWRGVWGNTLDTLGRRGLDGWAATVGLALGSYGTLAPPAETASPEAAPTAPLPSPTPDQGANP